MTPLPPGYRPKESGLNGGLNVQGRWVDADMQIERPRHRDGALVRPGRRKMITHYDMTTGEWISADEAQQAPPGDSRRVLPAPTPRLMEVQENIGSSPEEQGIPADIAGLPVSFVLAKWC